MPPRLRIPPPTLRTTLLAPLAPPARLPILLLAAPSVRFYAAAPAQKRPPGQKPKKTGRSVFKLNDLRDADQFSLLEAMRYIRAFEVGQNPVQVKYELAVKLKTQKSGPTVKSRIRLPKPVKTDLRVCVIAEGKHAEAATRMGAALVGTEDVFEKFRNGELGFDKVLCHESSFQALTKARLGRILGPKGLMPSQKYGTVVASVSDAMKDLVGKSDYRERMGVIRLAVGQLAFTELELSRNIRAFMDQLKRDFGQLGFRAEKSVHEVVLSSTNSPGFSLSGELRATEKEEVVVVESAEGGKGKEGEVGREREGRKVEGRKVEGGREREGRKVEGKGKKVLAVN